VFRRLRPAGGAGLGRPAARSGRQEPRRIHRALAAPRRQPREPLGTYVGPRQAGDRGGQRLGHGRRFLVSACRRHHDCLRQGGVRAAGSAAGFQYQLSAHRFVRLEGSQPLGADRRPFRRPGGAAHRHGQRGGAARPTDAARPRAGQPHRAGAGAVDPAQQGHRRAGAASVRPACGAAARRHAWRAGAFLAQRGPPAAVRGAANRRGEGVSGNARRPVPSRADGPEIETAGQMRNFMRWVSVFATAILLAIAAPAWAEEALPQRPVTIVVPFQAGGSADLLARILQQHMEADFHSPFVVENRSGAGGSVGTSYVAKAPNDGYTLLLGTLSGNVLNEFVFSKLSYDPERDFQPISLLVHLPNLLVVNQKVPAKTVAELIAYLKANDGKLNYGSSGVGTSSQLSVVMFELATGTRMTHVPFRSTTDELTATMSGNIDLAIDSMTTLWPQAQAGAVRALAVTSAQRLASAPDLPTIGETIKGFSVTGWQGLFAPAGTPRPIVEKLAAEVKHVFEAP